MELFKLFGSIFVDDKDAIDKINNVDDKAKNTGTTLGSMLGTAAKWGAGIAAGAAAAGAGLFALASEVSDTASEINDMSVRTGLSTKTLQEMKFATGQVGVNFESITGAVGKLTKTMAGADDGSKAAEAAFAKLGISVTDSEGNMRKMDDVFPEVIKGLAGMGNETERNQLAMDFFGKGATELVPLLAAGGDGIDALTQQAHDLGLVMSDEAISAGDNFGDSLDAIKGALGGVVASIGVELMPMFQTMFDWVMSNMPAIQDGIHTAFSVAGEVIGTAVTAIQSLTQFFTEHWGIIQPILAGIGAGAATFGIYTLAINASAIATGIWSTVTGIATAVGTAFGAVLAFISSPIGLVVIAIAALVAAGVLLYKNWDTVSAFLKMTWEATKDIAMTVFNSIGKFMSDLWAGTKTVTETVWNSIKSFFSTVWDGIKFIFFNLTLAGILIKHWDDITATVTRVWNSIKVFLSGLWDDISGIASRVFDGISGFLSRTWEGIKSTASTAWNGVSGLISGVWDSIKTKVEQVWNGLKTFVTGIWDGLKTTASEKFGDIKASLSNIWDDITKKVGSVWNGIASTVRGSINSVIGWINSFINSVNRISIKVPSVEIPLVGKVGGFTVGMPSIPNIPMLARGGNILDDGSFMVGEQGPEILSGAAGARVTPLDKSSEPAVVFERGAFEGAIIMDDYSVDRLMDRVIMRLQGLVRV